jgi:serine/threonine protein kinase/Tol biopolymer transport system component
LALTSGTRVGVYEIVSLVGAGGMGEVYRARDARLGRDVAIKVLPPEFSKDPERLQRFEQEARSAAALNHPNIITLYDIGTHEGSPYIVSELLEGETLRERLEASDAVASGSPSTTPGAGSRTSGALPVRKAVDIAVQVARGLAAAHEKGIVHRDLKPDNVFVTADGRTKILDFGLAKLTQAEPAFASMSMLPTTPPNTMPGVVLGTIGYMSPEQVRGLAADHRSDIFSFGAILYEMLAGQRAFRGDTTADTMTAILKEDPPDLPSGERQLPPALARIVHRCVEKAPAARFQTASDLAFALETMSAQSGPQSVAPASVVAMPAPRVRTIREALAWAVAVVGVLAALFFAFRSSRFAPSELQPIRFTIAPPAGVIFPLNQATAMPAISPDGRAVAFLAQSRGISQIWIRFADTLESRPLPGTDNVIGSFFWSSDSRYLGFFTLQALKRVDVSGTPPAVVWEGPFSAAPTGMWNDTGTIVFAPNTTSALLQVSASGGQPKPVTTLDASRKETGHRASQFLPDGRHFLYWALPGVTTFIGSVDPGNPKPLLVADSKAVYSAGHLLFVRQGTLLAQPFDLSRFELNGAPFPVAPQVETSAAIGTSAFAASVAGALAYRAGVRTSSRFEWFDRTGRPAGTVGEEGQWGQFSLSPDDRQIVVPRVDPQNGDSDLWLIETTRGVARRLTSEPGNEGDAIWSPDGQSVAFTRLPKGVADIFRRSVATGEDALLVESPQQKFPEDWSRDGKFLVFDSPATGRTIQILPLTGQQKPFVFLDDRFQKDEPHFSPDGRWLAYESSESGQFDVYVQPFPGPGPKVRVSPAGGGEPRWRADGKEIFYLTPDGTMMAAPIKTTATTIESGTPQLLFKTPIAAVQLTLDQYAVTSDGQRFLIQVPTGNAGQAPITVVLNWAAGLKK